jgi:SseB protein.
LNTGQPVDNPELVAAMNAFLADGTEENERGMLSAAQQAHFLAPAIIAQSSGEPATAVPTGTHIQFEMAVNQRNQHFFPAFTDWEQLRLWKNTPDQKTVVIQLRNYATMLQTQGAGIVINPRGQNLVFSREHIFRMLNPATPHTIEKNAHVIMGEPAAWPEKLAETLTARMRTLPAIRAAWLQLMVKGGTESFLVVVDAEGDPAAAFDELAKAAKPALGPQEIVDMVPANEEFAQSILENTQPFYTRDNAATGM